METDGVLSPATLDEARDYYDLAGPVAQTTVKEVAKAMGFDREEYRQRVTGDVVETARDAVFASLLAVQVGDSEEFEEWRADFEGEVEVLGSEHVDRVVWHAFDGAAVAATFQDEPEAARATLRRQAFGSLYRDVL